MAKRKDIEAKSSEPAAKADGAPEPANRQLPSVESPSISPATPAPVIEPLAAEPAVEPIAAAVPASTPETVTPTVPMPANVKRFAFKPRHQRNALLAASVAIAAALGVVLGAVASGGIAAPARTDVAALENSKAMQQSIARLDQEITALKSSLEAANKSAHSQVAKITERLNRDSAEITGSIAAPQTVTPLPTPRPTPRMAAVETQPSMRALVVQGWSIRDARDGYVYVEGHGDIYQVVAGAPLPGLGAVESVKRQDGRWVVTTPKGIIVSMRDRRYFESF